MWRRPPGPPLVPPWLSAGGVTVPLPCVPAALPAWALARPPVGLVVTLVGITGCYIVAAELTKRAFFRAGGQATSQRAAPSRSGWMKS